jgi:acyl-CoA thioesterase-1
MRDGLAVGIMALTLACGTLAAQAAPGSLMLYGDSLMAGYGLRSEDGFAAQLTDALVADGYAVNIINASVSGDTSAAALERLDWSLAERPDAVLLGLGGNDMLQGLSPDNLASNLDAILTRLEADDIPVLLLGMQASPGLGTEYVTSFNSVYPALARKFDLPLYPFFLEGVALDDSLNQPDRIHPNAAGVKTIVARILPQVETLLSAPN